MTSPDKDLSSIRTTFPSPCVQCMTVSPSWIFISISVQSCGKKEKTPVEVKDWRLRTRQFRDVDLIIPRTLSTLTLRTGGESKIENNFSTKPDRSSRGCDRHAL